MTTAATPKTTADPIRSQVLAELVKLGDHEQAADATLTTIEDATLDWIQSRDVRDQREGFRIRLQLKRQLLTRGVDPDLLNRWLERIAV